ncbi:Inosine-5'-monophosphate dehydrogenase [Asticcacaulis sp. MM231]|uniref:CBS domain-containing protein n=1 Tax=Asticcacaulis sp. MM231 TaxID=3157666 RepID=UPI0032D584FD
MLINQLLSTKGREVYTVTPDDSLASVAALLYTRKVGAFVVTDRVGAVVGIVSERDIVRAIATTGGQSLGQPVSQVMTREVFSAGPGETVDALLGHMTDRRIRHLPVMESGRLIGIVSIGDLVKAKIAASEHEAQTLKAYISAG